jgi:hypothetical protein
VTYDSLDELNLAKARRARELYREAQKFKHAVARYYDDPIGFAADCIDWPDHGLVDYQNEIVDTLARQRRVAVRGPHGLGKSTIAAIAVLWFALTRDAKQTDWKIMTTAGAWRQLINYLWPEIRKWSGRLRWDKVRDRPFTRNELLNLNLRLTYGAASAAACSNPALIEGAHADSLLFIYDEAKAIPAGTFDACEGAFSGIGESFALALSTPGVPQGRFYDIHVRKPGYADWHVVHVSLDDAIRAGRILPDWARDRATQWGPNSALYQNRVLGEFYAGEEDSIIPLSWVEAAVERWYTWDLAGRPDTGRPHTVGVDVARSGEDKTVLALRQGYVITELRVSHHEDTMATTGRVAGVQSQDASMTSIVDLVGIGAGVYDRLREQGYRTEAFNAAAKTERRDVSGELGFLNCRAGAWYNVREMLDPAMNPELCLPDDEDLLGDLTAPRAGEILSGGRIKVESKEDIKARIGRSTDRGDAVVQACWTEKGTWQDAYGTLQCPRCARGYLAEVSGSLRTACPFCGAPVPREEGAAR